MDTHITNYSDSDLLIKVDKPLCPDHNPSVFFSGTEGILRQFLTWDQIRFLRDDCNRALAERHIEQATQKQAAEIKRDIDKLNRELPPAFAVPTQCACGRELLTTTELKVQTCHICLTNDGTLLGDEQKYVPGAMV